MQKINTVTSKSTSIFFSLLHQIIKYSFLTSENVPKNRFKLITLDSGNKYK